MTSSSSIESSIIAWIQGDRREWNDFNQAAMALFQYQCEENEMYGQYVKQVHSKPIRSWQDIPSVSTDLFKVASFRLQTFPSSEKVRTFLTSGTSQEVKGKHEFSSLLAYETSILECWKQLQLPALQQLYILAQDSTDAPYSSLSYMLDYLTQQSALPSSFLIDANGSIDPNSLYNAVRKGEPIGLCGTAISLTHFMNQFPPFALPEGSWIFETGGYKGTQLKLEPEDFHLSLQQFFHVPKHRILNEYSMTELSSQFYRWSDQPYHQGPEWTRIRVFNPITGQCLPHGEMGYLEIIDLANVGSVMAIRTQDLAIAANDCSFQLIGRDPQAIARGCSRAADELLKR